MAKSTEICVDENGQVSMKEGGEWDPDKPLSALDYASSAYLRASLAMEGKTELEWKLHGGVQTQYLGGKFYPPLWWTGRRLKLTWTNGISPHTVKLVAEALKKGLDQFWWFDCSIDLVEQDSETQALILSSMKSGHIDEQKLANLCLFKDTRDRKRGGEQHADIILTDKKFLVHKSAWGVGAFESGAIIMALSAERQRHDSSMARVAVHELGHLMGIKHHCEDYRNVEQFVYQSECCMHSRSASERFCGKCKLWSRTWWKAVGI